MRLVDYIRSRLIVLDTKLYFLRRKLATLFQSKADIIASQQDLEELRKALQSGSGEGFADAGFPLKVESLEATLKSVTFDELDLVFEQTRRRYVGGTAFSHDKTGKVYHVQEVVKLKVMYPFSFRNLKKLIRDERRWVIGVRYGERYTRGQYVRELTDFLSNMRELSRKEYDLWVREDHG